MREVALIAAYTPDSERLSYLVNLVDFLHINKKDIILVSHSSNTPSYVIDKCKYFLYSSENELIDLPDLKMFMNREGGDFIYGSKFINKYKNTTLAIYNMLLLGSTIAKNLGYDIVHYIEYDFFFKSPKIFDYINEKIKEGSEAVLVKTSDSDCYGAFLSFNVTKFSYDDLVYNKNFLIEALKKYFVTEKITREYFFKNKKIHYIEYNDFKKSVGYSQYNHAIEKNYFIFPALFDGKIQIVHDNQNEEEENILVIVNDNLVFHSSSSPGNFKIFPIGLPEEIEKIIILINDILIETYDLSDPYKKESLFKESFIKRK